MTVNLVKSDTKNCSPMTEGEIRMLGVSIYSDPDGIAIDRELRYCN